MDLQTVSEISRRYGISTRMLRYYEQSGLITSQKREGIHTGFMMSLLLNACNKVIILRKLQIPLKQISVILDNPNAATVVEIFEKILKI